MKKKIVTVLVLTTTFLFLLIMGGCNKEEPMLWFEHSFTKITKDSKNSCKKTYTIYMAQNEYESCQFVITQEQDMEGLSISLSPFTDSKGNVIEHVILEEYFVAVGEYMTAGSEKKDMPDPIVPINEDHTFSVKAGEHKPFLVRLQSTKDTPAGDYEATLKILQGDLEISSATIKAHVWDFCYPETKSCATAMGLSEGYIAKAHGLELGDETHDLYIKYYEFLLDYCVSAYDLPYNILSPEADKYLNDPAMTSFKVPYSKNDDTIKAYYEKISSNPDWLDKAYFYPLDEPSTVEHYMEFYSFKERLDRLFPGNQICVPFFVDPDFGGIFGDAIENMDGVIDIWCPKAYCYDDKNIYGDKMEEYYERGYGSFHERMLEMKKKGDKIWWYVCWEPGIPYANLFVDMEGIYHRILFWQQKDMEVDGFLYWHTNYWADVDDPWTDMSTVKWIDSKVYGDGSLLYNGNKVGIDGPVASLRLEAVRDGVEDFEMLSMLEECIGKEKLDKYMSKVTSSMTKYTTKGDAFAKARINAGNALEKELKK